MKQALKEKLETRILAEREKAKAQGCEEARTAARAELEKAEIRVNDMRMQISELQAAGNRQRYENCGGAEG